MKVNEPPHTNGKGPSGADTRSWTGRHGMAMCLEGSARSSVVGLQVAVDEEGGVGDMDGGRNDLR